LRSYVYSPTPNQPWKFAWDILATNAAVPQQIKDTIANDFTFMAMSVEVREQPDLSGSLKNSYNWRKGYIYIYIYIHIHINPQGFFSTTAGYRPFLSRQVWFRIALRSRDIKTSGAPDMPLPRALLHPLPWNRLQGGPWMQQILLSFGENLLLRGAYSEDVRLHS
jgi:hypothetical protein